MQGILWETSSAVKDRHQRNVVAVPLANSKSRRYYTRYNFSTVIETSEINVRDEFFMFYESKNAFTQYVMILCINLSNCFVITTCTGLIN